MKRFGFITYDGVGTKEGRRITRQITRDAKTRNPIQVGVVVDSGGSDDTVLELEVRDNGQWSLVERPYGSRRSYPLAEGKVGS